MAGLNFPIIPYRPKRKLDMLDRTQVPVDISQAEDAMARDLFAKMGPLPIEEPPALPFEALAAPVQQLTPELALRGAAMKGPELPIPTPNRMGVERPNELALERIKTATSPLPVVVAEDAKLSELPLERINVAQADIDAGLRSPYANEIRAAQAMRTNFDESKPRSFAGKVGHHAKGALVGLLEGLSRGDNLGQMLGGGLMGAGMGLASPRIATNLSNQRELAQRLEENVQSENLRYRKEQQEQQRRQQQAIEADRQERLTLAQLAARERAAKEEQTNKEQAEARERQKVIDAQALENKLRDDRLKIIERGGERDSGWSYGKSKNAGERVSLSPTEAYRMLSPQQEQDRKLEVARAMGDVSVGNQVKAQALLAPGRIAEGDVNEQRRIEAEKRANADRERRDAEKEETARFKEAKNAVAKFEAIKNRAAKQDEEAKGFKSNPDKHDAKTASAQGDWDSARREAEIAAQMYPDLIEVGGLGEGEFPYMKLKEPKGGGAATSGGKGKLSTQSGNYKAGDVVKYKGQRHKILRFENGQPVLDPNPIK